LPAGILTMGALRVLLATNAFGVRSSGKGVEL
jgi:hypothetical protein